MPFHRLDTTGNEDLGSSLRRINTMLLELYEFASAAGGGGGAESGGAIEGDSATISGAMSVGSLQLGTGEKTAVAAGGEATLDAPSGTILDIALTTAAGDVDVFMLTNSEIAVGDQVLVMLQNGSNTDGRPTLGTVTPEDGGVLIGIANVHATEALNGTIGIAFAVLKN